VEETKRAKLGNADYSLAVERLNLYVWKICVLLLPRLNVRRVTNALQMSQNGFKSKKGFPPLHVYHGLNVRRMRKDYK